MEHSADVSAILKLEEESLRERLELFQLFTSVYGEHRDWFKQLLVLRQRNMLPSTSAPALHYVQGVIVSGGAYLVSNLMAGRSQTIAPQLDERSTPTWTLGRDPRRSTLAVLDRRLSRCHAKIQYLAGQGFELSDASSTNGTFVDGEPVVGRCLLQDGSQIRLGSLSFCFFVHAAVLPAAASLQPSAVKESELLGTTWRVTAEQLADNSYA